MSAVAGVGQRRLRSAGLLALVLSALAADHPLSAQEPTPPARDTLPVRRDTLGVDTLPALQQEPDTIVLPAARLPAMPLSPVVSPAGTEWVWDRETLLREAPVSLIDLLERIPGITTFRAGTFVQPEAVSVFGGTAGRTEIQLDGYILDPLTAATFDLSQIPLGQLRELRVQRRLGLLRIIITTEFPDEGRPYSRVEAGIGIPAANMFRGLFLVPHVIVGPLGLGIERVDADGIGRAEPAGLFSGWAKWSWTNAGRGVQFELLRSTVKREPNSPWPLERVRQDMVVRARNQFAPGFVAEAYAGRSQLDETVPAVGDETEDSHFERESLQVGIRMGLGLPRLALNASARYRSQEHLARAEGGLDAETALGPLRLGAEVGAWSWGGYRMSYASARGEIGYFGASAFGELTHGIRGAPLFEDTIGDGVIFTDRSGWRAGVALDLGRASGSIALARLDQDFTVPFDLPFDTAGMPEPLEPAQGLEARGRLVIWPRYLTLSSWITDWREAPGWLYLPRRSWRTALELHALPLRSGNLEIFGRAEAHMRGSTQVYDPAPEAGGTAVVMLPAFTTADAYLQIRIIDVRMFIRWEDLLGNDIAELSGRVYRGQRIFYGVKWNLWN